MERWVLKIGGSLHGDPRLPQVVRRISRLPHAVMVVPGGGVFADQVRSSQKRWRFDDRCAHSMALLAMRQYGYLLASLGALDTTASMKPFPPSAGARVWLPDETALGKVLAPSWDVTSDSVAAWLACTLRADWLVLVKPVSIDAVEKPAMLVDKAFPSMIGKGRDASGGGVSCAVASPAQWLSEDFSCAANQLIIDQPD